MVSCVVASRWLSSKRIGAAYKWLNKPGFSMTTLLTIDLMHDQPSQIKDTHQWWMRSRRKRAVTSSLKSQWIMYLARAHSYTAKRTWTYTMAPPLKGTVMIYLSLRVQSTGPSSIANLCSSHQRWPSPSSLGWFPWSWPSRSSLGWDP